MISAAKLEKRFWARAVWLNGCLVWFGGKDRGGYGVVRRERLLKAHRVAWQLVNGDIPARLCVLHKCDNPPCINPDHLFLGTMKQNMVDRDSKGRQCKGDCINTAKLNSTIVLRIRRCWAFGESCSALGRRYGVSANQISLIVRRRNWKHIP